MSITMGDRSLRVVLKHGCCSWLCRRVVENTKLCYQAGRVQKQAKQVLEMIHVLNQHETRSNYLSLCSPTQIEYLGTLPYCNNSCLKGIPIKVLPGKR